MQEEGRKSCESRTVVEEGKDEKKVMVVMKIRRGKAIVKWQSYKIGAGRKKTLVRCR